MILFSIFNFFPRKKLIKTYIFFLNRAEKDISKAFQEICENDEQFQMDILLYCPVDFKIIENRLKDKGYKFKAQEIKDFLDSQVSTLKQTNEINNNNLY